MQHRPCLSKLSQPHHWAINFNFKLKYQAQFSVLANVVKAFATEGVDDSAQHMKWRSLRESNPSLQRERLPS